MAGTPGAIGLGLLLPEAQPAWEAGTRETAHKGLHSLCRLKTNDGDTG